MLSFTARLLIAASIVLIAFLSLTGVILAKAFSDTAREAVRERLQAQVYILLGAAELNANNQLQLPSALPEARFSTPGSGLYAEVLNQAQQPIWRSNSMLGVRLQTLIAPNRPGIAFFQDALTHAGNAVFALGFTVSWEVDQEQYRSYTFWVAETQQVFLQQIDQFQRHLWTWLLVAALALLLVQVAVLRWSLLPLRKVAREVSEIEAGSRELLSGPYPKELRLLTSNLNGLVSQSRALLQRYRNALGDLAHSLKTPLAVLSSVRQNAATEDEIKRVLDEQLVRMNETLNYQLQRAAAAGRIALSKPVPLAQTSRKILDSLAKVYADKKLALSMDIDPQLIFRGDEGDLMEILGNIADNASKWSTSQVHVGAKTENQRLLIWVDDDGPGIAPDQKLLLLERGQRADESIPGHGIGLAIVKDIVENLYHGRLTIETSPFGGARIVIDLALEIEP